MIGPSAGDQVVEPERPVPLQCGVSPGQSARVGVGVGETVEVHYAASAIEVETEEPRVRAAIASRRALSADPGGSLETGILPVGRDQPCVGCVAHRAPVRRNEKDANNDNGERAWERRGVAQSPEEHPRRRAERQSDGYPLWFGVPAERLKGKQDQVSHALQRDDNKRAKQRERERAEVPSFQGCAE